MAHRDHYVALINRAWIQDEPNLDAAPRRAADAWRSAELGFGTFAAFRAGCNSAIDQWWSHVLYGPV
jgi:hypothetical protein